MAKTNSERQSKGTFARGFAIPCMALYLMLGACTTPAKQPSDTGPSVASAGTFPGPVTRDAYAGRSEYEAIAHGGFSRHVNGTTGLLGNVLWTYTTGPLVRPVSTFGSLGFLVKNTVADLIRQAYTTMFRLPALTANPIPPIANGPGMALDDWERELDRITGSPGSLGTLDFLIDGNQYFPVLLRSIQEARRSVHVRTYIFDNDDFAVGIADTLKRRSNEIEVRAQMDGIGTLTGSLAVSSTMPSTFDPPPSIARYLEEGSRIEVRTLTNPWFTGDHSKVTLIDRETAFVGGMNIGREYRFEWHDLMVQVKGPVVEELAQDCDRTWARSGFLGDFSRLFGSPRKDPVAAEESHYPVRVLYTRAQHSQIYEAQLAAIRRARSHVYIENPYFTDDSVLFELIAARRRGVDVRFVLSAETDAALVDMSNVDAVNKMLENGIRVYLYPRMTHVKAAIVDGWLMVGSANLDKLSLRVNNEINIATSHPAAVAALRERLFEEDFEKSVELRHGLPAGPRHQLAEVIADVFL